MEGSEGLTIAEVIGPAPSKKDKEAYREWMKKYNAEWERRNPGKKEQLNKEREERKRREKEVKEAHRKLNAARTLARAKALEEGRLEDAFPKAAKRDAEIEAKLKVEEEEKKRKEAEVVEVQAVSGAVDMLTALRWIAGHDKAVDGEGAVVLSCREKMKRDPTWFSKTMEEFERLELEAKAGRVVDSGVELGPDVGLEAAVALAQKWLQENLTGEEHVGIGDVGGQADGTSGGGAGGAEEYGGAGSGHQELGG